MNKEEKDKLIELSDLNMKDNIKYISSEAQGIAITLDSDRLAPSMCKLERAYICGRRKSEEQIEALKKENAELRKVAAFQQSSNMSRHFENKKLKEGIAVGSTFNKALNSMNKNLEEERDKYRNMVFDKADQLTRATEIIKKYLAIGVGGKITQNYLDVTKEAEQFLSEVEKC